MSETKWTPGPWSTHPEELRGGRYWVIDGPVDVQDPECDEPLAIHEIDNGKANAHLIAAAPDLYAALEKLLAKVECGTALNCAVCDAARAALSSARGETT